MIGAILGKVAVRYAARLSKDELDLLVNTTPVDVDRRPNNPLRMAVEAGDLMLSPTSNPEEYLATVNGIRLFKTLSRGVADNPPGPLGEVFTHLFDRGLQQTKIGLSTWFEGAVDLTIFARWKSVIF